MASDDTPADFATLLDWIEGRLSPDDAARVAERVASGDDRTRSTVDWLRDFGDMARQVEFEDPPVFVRRRLMQHFSQWRGERRNEVHDDVWRVGDVIAEPSFDSRRDRALAGVRGGNDDDVVHLSFTCEAADMMIDAVRNASGRVDLEVQVLPVDSSRAPRFEATVQGQGFTARSVESDDHGRFWLRDLPAGHCRLRADNGHLAIVAALDLDFEAAS